MPSTFGPVQRAGRASARAVAVAAGFLVLVGCAGQSSAPPAAQPSATVAPTTSAALSADLCSAAAEFQTAANALVNLDATQVGTNGVKQALQDLETAGSNLAAAAEDQFAPQVAELERAVASLRGTIAGLTDQESLSTNLGKIAASVGVVEQAAKPIVDSVRSGCPAVPTVQAPPTA